MGIFKRISDIISANLNDLVEDYEDPERLLKQAIREMEEAIQKSKMDVAKVMANEKTVAKELAVNERQVETWATRAETAVESGDDDLARKALVRKKEYEQVVNALKDQHEASVDASQTMKRQLQAMQAKLADAKRRLGTLVARKRAADVRSKMATAEAMPELSADQAAFDKFDRLSEKVELAEAEAEALSELAGLDAETPDEEPDFDDTDSDVDAELAELKKKAKKKD